MNIFGPRTDWYVAGLAFECSQCGRCCAGPEEGYVWLTSDEADEIARFLGITSEQMHKRYIRRIHRRLSLLEDPATHDCVFLQPNGSCSGKGCSIYEARPMQCRTWPFWPTNLARPENWIDAGMRCPGINRGKTLPYPEIQSRRNATED